WLLLDDAQDLGPELGDHPLGHHRANPLDQPRAQVAADALDGGRRHGGIEVHLELPAVLGVAAPAPGQAQASPTWAPSSGPTTVSRSGSARSVATRAMV